MAAKALHSSNRSALMRMTGSDEAGSQSKNDARVYYRVSTILHAFVTSRYDSCGLLKHDHKETASQQMAHVYGSSAVLKPPRDCTMLGSSMRRVGLIDITVGNATRLGAS